MHTMHVDEDGGIKMYTGLWNFITKHMDNSHAVSVFLPLVIAGWTSAGAAAGIIVCMAAGREIMSSLADIICAGGYAGVIFGLLGGCLFLYRKEI